MAEIARRLKLQPNIINEIMNHGRRSRYTNDVVAIALELIEAKKPDADIMKQAQGMKLTSNFANPVTTTRRKKKYSGEMHQGDNTILWIVGAIAVIVGFFVWKKSQAKPTGGLI